MASASAFLFRRHCSRNERRRGDCRRRRRSCTYTGKPTPGALHRGCDARHEKGLNQLGEGELRPVVCVARRIRRLYGKSLSEFEGLTVKAAYPSCHANHWSKFSFTQLVE